MRRALFFAALVFLLANVPAQDQFDYFLAYKDLADGFSGLTQSSNAFVRTPFYLAQVRTRTNPAPATEKPYDLLKLLDLYLRNNPSVRTSEEAVLVAYGNLGGAQAQRLPVFKLETTGTYIGNPPGPIVIKKGEFGIVENPVMPGTNVFLPPEDVKIYDGMESTLYQFKLSGDMPLWTWGKINLGIEAGKLGIEAARISLEKTIHEGSIRLRGIYETLGYLDRMLGILSLQRNIGARLLSISEQSQKAGFITMTELLSVKMNIKEIDIAILQLREQQNKLLNELSFLAGASSITMEDLDLEVKSLEYYPGSAETVYETVLAENYDLRLGLAYIEAKKKLVELAKVQANGLPDLGLHLEVSYSGPRFPFIETDWARKDDWQLTMSIATMGNIFGNPVKKADAQKAVSELGEAEAKLEEGRKNLLSFVQTSWSNTLLIKARIEYNLLKQQVSIEELGAKRFTISVGSGSEAELLNSVIKALSGLADAYTLCINHRTELLSLDLVQGK